MEKGEGRKGEKGTNHQEVENEGLHSKRVGEGGGRGLREGLGGKGGGLYDEAPLEPTEMTGRSVFSSSGACIDT